MWRLLLFGHCDNVKEGQELIEKFISQLYIGITELITNILERYLNFCDVVSFTKRSNETILKRTVQ